MPGRQRLILYLSLFDSEAQGLLYRDRDLMSVLFCDKGLGMTLDFHLFQNIRFSADYQSFPEILPAQRPDLTVHIFFPFAETLHQRSLV